MKKIGLTFIIFTVLATFGVHAQGDDTVETWRCGDIMTPSTIVVELTRKAGFEFLGQEQISVAGVTYDDALFYIEGLNRRWDFGKDLKYAFIIKPDGRGAYYDFSLLEEGETRTGPSQQFRCVSP